MRSPSGTIRSRASVMLALCVTCLLGLCSAAASTLCVNPKGSQGCFSKIQAAVNHATANDIINVGAGTYKEEVDIGIPLSLIGAGTNSSVIDATGFAHGIFVDGFSHPGVHDVTIAGFTVSNALFEGVLVVSATDVVIRNNRMTNNDKSSGLQFTGALTGCPDQPGNGTYETDETGDCGGALHLVGTSDSTVSDNVITGNADGVLISDETAESQRNLLIHNIIQNNPLECGIVLASHAPSGQTAPPFAPHHGVDRNTIAENLSANNGVQVGGAGVGMFSDGAGPGRVSGNVIIGNRLTNNGLGGVTLHTHVGPAFHLPPDNMDGNMIIGNVIAGNLADTFDTATPGRVESTSTAVRAARRSAAPSFRATPFAMKTSISPSMTPLRLISISTIYSAARLGWRTCAHSMAPVSAPAELMPPKTFGDVLLALAAPYAPPPADPIFVPVHG